MPTTCKHFKQNARMNHTPGPHSKYVTKQMLFLSQATENALQFYGKPPRFLYPLSTIMSNEMHKQALLLVRHVRHEELEVKYISFENGKWKTNQISHHNRESSN